MYISADEFDIGACVKTLRQKLWKPILCFANRCLVISRTPSSIRWCMTRRRRPCWRTKERSEWDLAFRQTYLKCYKRVSLHCTWFTLYLICENTATGFVSVIGLKGKYILCFFYAIAISEVIWCNLIRVECPWIQTWKFFFHIRNKSCINSIIIS